MRHQRLGKYILFCIVLCLCMVTSSCSYIINFTIKNLSDRDLTVSYSLRNANYGLYPELLDRTSAEGKIFIAFPESRSRIDVENRKVELILFPNEEVRILRMNDGYSREYDKEFNLTELNLSTSDGNASFKGSQVFVQFRPVERSAFSFGPRIVAFELEFRK